MSSALRVRSGRGPRVSPGFSGGPPGAALAWGPYGRVLRGRRGHRRDRGPRRGGGGGGVLRRLPPPAPGALRTDRGLAGPGDDGGAAHRDRGGGVRGLAASRPCRVRRGAADRAVLAGRPGAARGRGVPVRGPGARGTGPGRPVRPVPV